MEFYQIILQQLGGKRFIVMTGSSNFVYDKEKMSLSMKLTRNKINATHLRITLTSMDLYKMEFLRCTDTIKTLETRDGIYDDMLQDIFTDVTGLYTHL